jgi:hypothetical protein
VYNAAGMEIKTLVSQELNAGTYLVNFDAQGITSGVYFYRISAGDFTDTKKMILVK